MIELIWKVIWEPKELIIVIFNIYYATLCLEHDMFHKTKRPSQNTESQFFLVKDIISQSHNEKKDRWNKKW